MSLTRVQKEAIRIGMEAFVQAIMEAETEMVSMLIHRTGGNPKDVRIMWELLKESRIQEADSLTVVYDYPGGKNR